MENDGRWNEGAGEGRKEASESAEGGDGRRGWGSPSRSIVRDKRQRRKSIKGELDSRGYEVAANPFPASCLLCLKRLRARARERSPVSSFSTMSRENWAKAGSQSRAGG
jgi:hypothetical protein